MELTNRITSATEVVITLKEITDLIDVQHSKAMKKVEKLALEPSFGEVAKMDTLNLSGVTVKTYGLTKKQAIAVGAKLNNKLLMTVIDRLEELEIANRKPKVLSKREILLMALELEEANEKLQLENKELKRTKAHISDKKTATAMGKLGSN